MIDVAELAKEAVIALSPALPYLAKGGEQALEEASKNICSAVYEKAVAIWSKITSSSGQSGEEVKKAAKKVADTPADFDAQAALRDQIKKLLREDKELFSEIDNFLHKEPDTYHGGVHIGGHATVTAVNIIGGDQVLGK